MLGKVTFKSNALQYALCFKVIHYVFFSPELGLFISFLITKNPQVIFLPTVRILSHQK